jgi:hypothetical protein
LADNHGIASSCLDKTYAAGIVTPPARRMIGELPFWQAAVGKNLIPCSENFY